MDANLKIETSKWWQRAVVVAGVACVIAMGPTVVQALDYEGDGVDDAIDTCDDLYNPSQADPVYGDDCTIVTWFENVSFTSVNDIAISGDKAYVATAYATSVPVVNLTSRAITKYLTAYVPDISRMSTSTAVEIGTVDSTTNKVFIGNFGNMGVEQEKSTEAYQEWDTVDSSIANTSSAYSLSLSSSGLLAIGMSTGSSNFRTYNLAAGTLSSAITLSGYVSALTTSSNKAYVISNDGTTYYLSVVDLATLAVSSTTTISAAGSIAVDDDQLFIGLSNYTSSIQIKQLDGSGNIDTLAPTQLVRLDETGAGVQSIAVETGVVGEDYLYVGTSIGLYIVDLNQLSFDQDNQDLSYDAVVNVEDMGAIFVEAIQELGDGSELLVGTSSTLAVVNVEMAANPVIIPPLSTDPNPDNSPDPASSDLDADGTVDQYDNCVYVANADQADQDDDRVGTECQDITIFAEGTVLDVVGTVVDEDNNAIYVAVSSGGQSAGGGIAAFDLTSGAQIPLTSSSQPLLESSIVKYPKFITMTNGKIYVGGNNGVAVITNLLNTGGTRSITSITSVRYAYGIDVETEYAYATSYTGTGEGLYRIKLSDNSVVSISGTSPYATAVVVQDNIAYVGTQKPISGSDLDIVNLTSGLTSSVNGVTSVRALALDESSSRLYIASPSGLQIAWLDDDGNVIELSSPIDDIVDAWAMTILGEYIYVATKSDALDPVTTDDLKVIDVSELESAGVTTVGYVDGLGDLNAIFMYNNDSKLLVGSNSYSSEDDYLAIVNLNIIDIIFPGESVTPPPSEDPETPSPDPDPDDPNPPTPEDPSPSSTTNSTTSGTSSGSTSGSTDPSPATTAPASPSSGSELTDDSTETDGEVGSHANIGDVSMGCSLSMENDATKGSGIFISLFFGLVLLPFLSRNRIAILLLLFFSACSGGGSTGTGGIGSVSPLTPVAEAGNNQTVTIGDVVALDGSASVEVQSAQWTILTRPAGSVADIADPNLLVASFTPDQVGAYTVELSINGGATSDTVSISVEVSTSVSTPLVVARAGDDRDVFVEEQVTLDGSTSDGASTVAWTFVSRPDGSAVEIDSATSISTSFAPDLAGDYEIELSLNDGESTDRLTVTAEAGTVLSAISVVDGSAIQTRERLDVSEYVVNLGDSGAYLSAANSRTRNGASIVSYEWEEVWGPAATIDGGAGGTLFSFSAPATLESLHNASDPYKWGILPISRDDTKMVFKLTVTDNNGNTDSATVPIYLEDNDAEIHTSSGLPNIPINNQLYLSGPSQKVGDDGSVSEVTDWQWTLSVPSGSQTKFIDTQALTSTVQFPSFIPDTAGFYYVDYSSTSSGDSGRLTLSASDWVGVGTIAGMTATGYQCGVCHTSSNTQTRLQKWEPWSQTRHATVFERNMDTYATLAPEPWLWPFNSVGFNQDVANSGFDDLAAAEALVFPESGMEFDDFAATYPSSTSRANVQCENCHGPGSGHAGKPDRIAYSLSQPGVCAQCHLEASEWENSVHHSTGVVYGDGTYQSYWTESETCTRCHYSAGFVRYVRGTDDAFDNENGTFPGVTCATCHDPHDATNPKQLRVYGDVTMLIDGSTVDAGRAAVCYTCHDGSYAYGEELCDSDEDGRADTECLSTDQTAIQYFRAAHINMQAPILEGKGALTDLDDDSITDIVLDENSFHQSDEFIVANFATTTNASYSENRKCVTCHMSTGPSEEEDGYRKLGGHAFAMRNGSDQNTGACLPCHGVLSSINRTARENYDGDDNGDDGVEGVQDEVKGLLKALSDKLKELDSAEGNIDPDSGTVEVNGQLVAKTLKVSGSNSELPDGVTCSDDPFNPDEPGDSRDNYQPCNFIDLSRAMRRAMWNYNLIARDRSFGVHNMAFIVQVLQGTYTAVGGNTFAADYPEAAIR